LRTESWRTLLGPVGPQIAFVGLDESLGLGLAEDESSVVVT
jgi:hypothetical protein